MAFFATPFPVSVIIPAFNAAETIEDTLRSLKAQTYPYWEAVVVDDGSTDATAELAAGFGEDDERIRLVRQPNGGLSDARNRGIDESQYDALLFLDADDLMTSGGLEHLVNGLRNDPEAGVAYGGWRFLTPDGHQVLGNEARRSGILFNMHAKAEHSVVHSYLVRREVLEAAGRFDTTLRSAEDWDMWQRVARIGTHFRAVPEIVALYRIRGGSMSKNAQRMLEAMFTVLDRCHSVDPRVADPLFLHGRAAGDLDERRHQLLCAVAGCAYGGGGDPVELLASIPAPAHALDIHPYHAAAEFAVSALVASGRPFTEWPDAWRDMQAEAMRFADAVAARMARRGFARQMRWYSRISVLTYLAPLGGRHRIRAAAFGLVIRVVLAVEKRAVRLAETASLARTAAQALPMIASVGLSSMRRRLGAKAKSVTAANHDSKPLLSLATRHWTSEPATRLPILMYHRVAPAGAAATAPWRISPGAFEDHLRLLRESGCTSVTLDQWQRWKERSEPIPAGAVIITFDDGYADFMDLAWPLLRKYGFTATMYAVTGEIAGSNTWDHRFGEQLPLLGWKDLRTLHDHGIQIGAHTVSHPMLAQIPVERAIREMLDSKRMLERRLDAEVTTVAYPHGDCSPRVFAAARVCGFRYGVTCVERFADRGDAPLALPRFDVGGTESAADFARMIGLSQPAASKVA